MTAVLVRLKLRLLVGQFRRSPWQVVGLVLALLYGAGITLMLVVTLVALRLAPAPISEAVVIGGGSLAVLAFLIVPIFVGIDDTLDPRRFALFGLDRTRLAIGLAVAGVVGVPGLALLLVAFATVATWSRSPLAALVALVSVPIIVLTCVLLSRIAATSAGLLLSTRRSRETVAAVLVIGISLLAPLVVVLTNLELGRRALTAIGSVVAVLAWTPLGAAWAAPASVASGSAAGALQLLIAVVTVVVLGLVWRALVGVALVSSGRQAKPQTLAGIGWFGRLPASPRGAIAARATSYWARDVRYRVSAISIPVTPIVLVLVLGLAGVDRPVLALIPVPVVALFLGWATHNDIAYDHTAIWLHVAAGVRGVDDRLGRLAPVLVVGLPLLVAGSFVSAAVAGRLLLAAPLIGVAVCLLLVGMGIGGVSSALMPYPVPRPGSSPFQQPNSTGGLAAVVQSVLFLLQLVLSAPAIVLGLLAVQGSTAAAWGSLAAGLVVGALVLRLGTAWGGRVFERRGPEILAAALRA
ncbi:ABC transporter permease [Amnibacterium kyonggiense]|uniref:ABC-2 type transport system permease protein n=1 Tax=Amnibacterium kyonggiense TaxID=595671 RepID=A0A4V3EAD2_9MICO|nr:ABC transporter permease [Amnibacterium kyonggiense]TDS75938.1 ABC-2 type transport system permease protein [Amnibacterium kyonggiense]